MLGADKSHRQSIASLRTYDLNKISDVIAVRRWKSAERDMEIKLTCDFVFRRRAEEVSSKIELLSRFSADL